MHSFFDHHQFAAGKIKLVKHLCVFTGLISAVLVLVSLHSDKRTVQPPAAWQINRSESYKPGKSSGLGYLPLTIPKTKIPRDHHFFP